MNVNEVKKDIKNNNLKPIYLILGQEEYLIEQLKKEFYKIIPDEEKTMNFASYDMESQNVAVAVEDAASFPFFGEKRLVFITNPYFLTGDNTKNSVDHDLDSFLEYITHPVDSTIMVIIAPYNKLDARKKLTKELKKSAEFIDFSQIDEKAVTTYVSNFIQNAGYQIENSTLQSFIERVSGDLSKAMNEIPKLLLYCQNDKVITMDAINSLVAKSLDQNVFDLINLVMKKNSKEAIDLYRNLLLEDQEPLQINGALISQFRLLIQVMGLANKGYSQGNIATKLGVHPYRAKLAMQNIRKYSFKSLSDAYLGLVDLETELKSTQESPELLFQMFTLKFVDNQIN